MPATISCPSAANSGPRWSIVGIAIACNTRSGTLVGPGICRKWRPLCAGAVFFIASNSLLLGRQSVGAKGDRDKACDLKTWSQATGTLPLVAAGTISERVLHL